MDREAPSEKRASEAQAGELRKQTRGDCSHPSPATSQVLPSPVHQVCECPVPYLHPAGWAGLWVQSAHCVLCGFTEAAQLPSSTCPWCRGWSPVFQSSEGLGAVWTLPRVTPPALLDPGPRLTTVHCAARPTPAPTWGPLAVSLSKLPGCRGEPDACAYKAPFIQAGW